MADRKSLLHYLDKQLPGSWAIRLRLLFSFLPFVKPVNEHHKKMRMLVNQAKKDSENYEYLMYYIENGHHFSFHHYSLKFTFSAKEKELLPSENKEKETEELKPIDSPRQITTLLDQLPKGNEEALAKNALTTTTVEERPNNYLSALLALLKEAHWNTSLKNYIEPFDHATKIDLLHGIILEFENKRTEQLKTCILFIIDSMEPDLKRVKHTVFNDLRHPDSVADFLQFLMIKGNSYRSELIALFDQLGYQSPGTSRCQYNVQIDYNAILSTLRGLRTVSPIHEHAETLHTLQEEMARWQEKHSPNQKHTLDLISKINSGLANALTIIEIIKNEPKLQQRIHREESVARERQRAEEERLEFTNALRKGKLITVSYQRLRELYPNDEEYEVKLKQCQKLQVTLFDATDEVARKHALDLQHIYTAGQSFLFNESLLNTDTATPALSLLTL